MSEDLHEIRPYSPTEIARIYGVSWKVMNTWLRPHREVIGKREGLYYTVNQVKIIFDKLGLPGTASEEAA